MRHLEPCCRLTEAAAYATLAAFFRIGQSPYGRQSVAGSHSTVQVGLQGDAIHLGAGL
jgi:hypothetical protein